MSPRQNLLRTLLAVCFLHAASGAWAAVSPEAKELIALQKSMAAEKCQEVRGYMEMMIVGSYPGGAARMQEIEKRSRAPRTPEREAQQKRFNELGKMKPTPEDTQAIMEVAGKLESYCPYGKEGVPLQIPPITDDAMARDAVLVYVPRTLMKLRQCEIFFPERRGVVEKAWTTSVFSKLAIPELQPPVDEVRAWLKGGLGDPLPGSMADRQMKDPNMKSMSAGSCDRSERDLARVEAALPPSFLAKHKKK